MKLKYLCMLFGVFYSAFMITAPTKNKSKRNTRIRSTSKKRPAQRKIMSRGKTSSRSVSRGRGSSSPSRVGTTPTSGITSSSITLTSPAQAKQTGTSQITPTSPAPTNKTPAPTKTLQPLDVAFFDEKVIRLDNEGKASIKKTKDKLNEIKNKLNKEKEELIKLQKSLEKKPKTLKEIEENYNKELDAKKNQKINN